MNPTPRARPSRQRLPVAGLLLVSASLLLLGGLSGCARSDAAAPPSVEARVEGHWLRPMSRGSRLVPCGHGHHVWVWTPGRAGLWLVDGEGRELAAPERFAAKDLQVVDVLPSAHPERAWVHVRESDTPGLKAPGAVYLVDHQGEVLGERASASSGSLELMPSEDRERLWVVSDFLSQLTVLDTEGRKTSLTLSTGGRAEQGFGIMSVARGWTSARKVIPVGDGRRGWLALDQGLHYVEVEARSPLGPSLLTARDLVMLPTGQSRRAWVLADKPEHPGQLYLVHADARTPPTLLLEGRRVQRLLPHRDIRFAWAVVMPDESSPAEVWRVGMDGRVVDSGLRAKGALALARAPDGQLWASDERGVFLLGDEGSLAASSPPSAELGGARLVPLSAGRAWAVTRDGRVCLLAVSGGSISPEEELPTGFLAPRLEAWDAEGGWLLSDEGTALHRITRGPGGLEAPLVLEGVGMGEVLPVPGTGRVWISGVPRSYVYGPASDVRRAAVVFAGGSRLEWDASGRARVEGGLETGAALEALELDWPGRAAAAEAGRTLRLALYAEAGAGELVGQGVQPLAGPGGLLFQWSISTESAERLYRAVLSHEVENGTRLGVTFQHVPFGVPLWDRPWVRTALACLGVTLLVLLPLLLLRPSAASRRWLPLIGYVASLVGLGSGELLGLLHEARIHLPTLVGVLGAELVLCAGLGLLSPAIFRRLVFIHPFSWAAAPLLHWAPFRRRFFVGYVRQVRRRVEVASARANGEVYVELGAHVTEYAGADVPPSPSEGTAARLATLLTRERVHLLLQCAGGRGKSALLRQVVRLALERFEARPDSPLPVFIDPAAEDLEVAAREALGDLGLPEGLRDALLESGDFFLVLDGLTESRLAPEALRRYLEREVGLQAPVLLSARPNEAFREAMEHALRWARVEPRRLDAVGLERFQEVYPGPDGRPMPLSEALLRICRGRAADGTYVPLLVRMALRFGGGDVDSVINLYRAVFAGLLKRAPDDAATSEMLAFAEALCLDSYWEHGSRLIVFRDSPEEGKLRALLDAGLLVPADARPGPVPTHVRFFHDSMQSYLTARALYARHAARAHWDCLWRAAGEPGFAREQSDLLTETGSELFQMCAYVFGYDGRLKRELMRHLELCAEANDERLTKEGILEAVPEELRQPLREASRGLGPGPLLSEASRACHAHGEGEALFQLYARIAPRAWPWQPGSVVEAREDAA
jgi:hypothetical protein